MQFSSPCLLPPSKVEIFSLTTFCNPTSLYVLLLICETKFRTVIERGAELVSCVCVFYTVDL